MHPYDKGMSKDEKPPTSRQVIAMPDGLWRDVKEYQAREGIATTAEAVRRLLVASLREVKQSPSWSKDRKE